MSWVRKLILPCHEDVYHSISTNHTLAEVSTNYWIISATEVVRGDEQRKAKLGTEVIAPLLAIRMKMYLGLFTNTAVDYARPLITIQGRSTRRAKRIWVKIGSSSQHHRRLSSGCLIHQLIHICGLIKKGKDIKRELQTRKSCCMNFVRSN